MLATFRGVIEHGQVYWIGNVPPEGIQFVAVASTFPSVEDQLARLRAIPPEERQKAFDEFIRFAQQEPPPEVDISQISDQELVDIVHEIRAERAGKREAAQP
jgi:hypothetical protein